MNTAGNHSGSDGSERIGYFVPESAWNELEQAEEALSMIVDLANHAPSGVVTSSARLKALVDIFQEKVRAVRGAGAFHVMPQDEA